mmetsp:Transcript_9456/g.23571  ORF Transcript_9456/g.23571 Transcript_9456/m.23571 type:complete len:235 (+) Transcript_9456:97-801(+)
MELRGCASTFGESRRLQRSASTGSVHRRETNGGRGCQGNHPGPRTSTGGRQQQRGVHGQPVCEQDCVPTFRERMQVYEQNGIGALGRSCFMTFTDVRDTTGSFGKFAYRGGGGGGGSGTGGRPRSASTPSIRKPSSTGGPAGGGKTFSEVMHAYRAGSYTGAATRRAHMTFTDVRDTSGSFGKFMYRGGGPRTSRSPSPCTTSRRGRPVPTACGRPAAGGLRSRSAASLRPTTA